MLTKVSTSFMRPPHLQSFIFIYVGNLVYYLLIVKYVVIKNVSRSNSTLKLHSLTPWSRVLLEKLTGSQLVKKFPAYYGTLWFITALTSARTLKIITSLKIKNSCMVRLYCFLRRNRVEVGFTRGIYILYLIDFFVFYVNAFRIVER